MTATLLNDGNKEEQKWQLQEHGKYTEIMAVTG